MELKILEQKEGIKGQLEKIDPRHDFKAKLLQPSILPYLKDYVRWQVEKRQSPYPEKCFSNLPDHAPVSINLDPTSACNYGCDHCVDKDILNTGRQYDFDSLKQSLELMQGKGLKSVIIIGGGEPTLYKDFENLVRFLKQRNMQVAVVSNGTGMDKIANVAGLFGKEDWIRLSLDSASERKFQEMHLPRGRMTALPVYQPNGCFNENKEKVPITLEQICKNVERVRNLYPNLTIGFSYIVTWPGAYTNNSNIESNLDEIVATAYLAKEHKFNYLALKAFLDRDSEEHSEVIGINSSASDYKEIVERIRANIAVAKRLETADFKVRVSTNLRALCEDNAEIYMRQPRECHITYFRQVLGIRGISICPAYRDVEKKPEAKIGGMDAYQSENYGKTRERVAERIHEFNSAYHCRNVVCMYNGANWFIEELIQKELTMSGAIDKLEAGAEFNDYFL